jgi:hypothetical protein
LIASKQLPVRNLRAFLLPEWIFREENLRLRQRDRVAESSKQSKLMHLRQQSAGQLWSFDDNRIY